MNGAAKLGTAQYANMRTLFQAQCKKTFFQLIIHIDGHHAGGLSAGEPLQSQRQLA